MKPAIPAIFSIVFLTITTSLGAGMPENNPPPPARELHTSSITACPADMVEIAGDFCPEVVQNCTNLDMTVHNVNGYVRCLEYAPTQCLSKKKVSMHFCMDKYEWPNQKNVKPSIMVSWYDMKRNCEDIGKRLCVD